MKNGQTSWLFWPNGQRRAGRRLNGCGPARSGRGWGLLGRRRLGCRWSCGRTRLGARRGADRVRRTSRLTTHHGTGASPRSRRRRGRCARLGRNRSCGRSGGGSCLRAARGGCCCRSCDRPSRCGFFLSQIRDGQFHRALNRQTGDALFLVDPGVAMQRGLGFFSRSLQFSHARFGALFLVFVAPRHHSEDSPNEEAEDGEEQDHAKPGSEGGTRLIEAELDIVFSHGQFTMRRDSIRRGSRTGKREAFATRRRYTKTRVAPMPINGTKSSRLTLTPVRCSSGKTTT